LVGPTYAAFKRIETPSKKKKILRRLPPNTFKTTSPLLRRVLTCNVSKAVLGKIEEIAQRFSLVRGKR
jgi:hypothetical protein